MYSINSSGYNSYLIAGENSSDGKSGIVRESNLSSLYVDSFNTKCERYPLIRDFSKSEEEVKAMMDVETWMDYKLAFEKGFATSIQKENDAEQSVKDTNSYIRKLVNENIELKQKLQKEKNNGTSEIKEDSWKSFFI